MMYGTTQGRTHSGQYRVSEGYVYPFNQTFTLKQFSAKNMINNRLAPLPGLEPLPLELENPGYVTDLITYYVMMTQF